MITDLNAADGDPFRDRVFDVCIVGAGVAGITLARKLAQTQDVCLLEGGGFNYSPESSAVYLAENTGQPYIELSATRQRFFGGTSNHWGGFCYPLEDYDFDQKDYAAVSGWPIQRSDLDPYLDETREILDIPLYDADTSAWGNMLRERIGGSGDFRLFPFWRSAPTRFGPKYRAELEASRSTHCFVNANGTRFTLNDNLDRIADLEVARYDGQRHRVKARRYVLATGGIENARFLLNSNQQIPTGIGNENGLVGRYFCEHPSFSMGDFLLEDDVKEVLSSNWTTRFEQIRYFVPTHSLMNQEKILNFNLHFVPSFVLGRGNFEQLLRKLACPGKSLIESITDTEFNCGTDGDFRINWEQAMTPDSRVMLNEDRDQFGLRRISLQWKLTELDAHTMRRGVMRFAEVFAERGVGRIRLPEWVLEDTIDYPGPMEDHVGGSHHMCTTRMAASPRDGVVDSQQKVFGVENLFIAGSSVFGSPGQANPTFTIVQTTLRLAEHLASLSAAAD